LRHFGQKATLFQSVSRPLFEIWPRRGHNLSSHLSTYQALAVKSRVGKLLVDFLPPNTVYSFGLGRGKVLDILTAIPSA